jgi:hypothetical protein
VWSYVVLGKEEIMEHDDALNLMLANACPRAENDGDIRYFEFDLHCATAKVKAEVVSTLSTIQYKIISVEIV